MITANISFKDGATKTKVFNSLTEALEKIKLELDIGDYFTIWEDSVLLAKGRMEKYRLDYGSFR